MKLKQALLTLNVKPESVTGLKKVPDITLMFYDSKAQ